jgi:hypothetical protein
MHEPRARADWALRLSKREHERMNLMIIVEGLHDSAIGASVPYTWIGQKGVLFHVESSRALIALFAAYGGIVSAGALPLHFANTTFSTVM